MFALFGPLTISALLGIACTFFHIGCMLGMTRLIRIERREEMLRGHGKLSLRGLSFTATLFMTLFVIHGIEIWTFAWTYLWLGALPDFETALYFSTISYSTVGYEDADILKEWRLIGAIESMVGIMLIGWSTAFTLRLLSRLEV